MKMLKIQLRITEINYSLKYMKIENSYLKYEKYLQISFDQINADFFIKHKTMHCSKTSNC